MIAPTTYDPTTWEGFGDFTVTVALSPEDRATANDWLEKEHPLGEFRPVGHSLMHIIREDGQPVAAIQWAACAYHLKDREEWIGWNAQTCARRRNLIVNNVRFVIPEATRRPNLASKALAHAVRALPGTGTNTSATSHCCARPSPTSKATRAPAIKPQAGHRSGLTEGNSRQRAEFYVPNKRPKKLWIKAAAARQPRAAQCQSSSTLPMPQGKPPAKEHRCPSPPPSSSPWPKPCVAVPDPRKRNRQHPIGPMLCMVALGILCGGDNLNAIVRHANRLTQAQRRVLGARSTRTSPGSRTWYYHVPDYETFRRLLLAIDLDAFGQVLTSWLSAHRGALPAQLALDGKVVRDQLGTIVTLCDTRAKSARCHRRHHRPRRRASLCAQATAQRRSHPAQRHRQPRWPLYQQRKRTHHCAGKRRRLPHQRKR